MMRGELQVELLLTRGCPHAQATEARLESVLARLGLSAELKKHLVATQDEAESLNFLGSPSVRINGRDLEVREGGGPQISCRLYEGGSGVPPEYLIEASLMRALSPRGVLFLCVANSARSQIAEGLARAMAPTNVRIVSAGSQPTAVRVEAQVVLLEQGIDISSHRSKHVDEISLEDVEVAVTLCKEEECPLFLGKALRLSWSLPDPAAIKGEGRLEAFRQTRDELARRFKVWWPES